jgi:hypothetical protein
MLFGLGVARPIRPQDRTRFWPALHWRRRRWFRPGTVDDEEEGHFELMLGRGHPGYGQWRPSVRFAQSVKAMRSSLGRATRATTAANCREGV